MKVDALLREACGKAFTGAVARVERGGRLCFERAYGATRNDAAIVPIEADGWFDLASLTKPFTATLALRAVACGWLDLDASLVRWFPSWAGRPHQAISLRMLLAHDSGMQSGADYRGLLADDVESYAIDRDLAAPPHQRVIYSDLGFIALGALLQRSTGRSLSAQVRASFGSHVGYRPAAHARAAIAATEEDAWRGRVQGFVHDEKAYLMNGVAGHAGLFGSAAAVSALTDVYLAAACGRAQHLLPQRLAAEAIREQAFDPVLRRGLGWALKTADSNSCGRAFSMSSFGHTGFVGTCVWADPARDLQGVLLTNSVYFGRSDTRDLRAAFFEAIADEFGGAA